MYDYHNNLRAGHAASSPWWAWLLDLKPVWFYQHGFANNTTGVIYDAENLVIVWLGIPAMSFAAWAAWHRRSLALTIIVLMFAAMWLPWSRIDRATFQYHVFTSLPFVSAGAGLLPGRALARAVAAASGSSHASRPRQPSSERHSCGSVRAPLCMVGGLRGRPYRREQHGQGIACGSITRSTDVSQAALVSVVILLIGGMVVLGWQLWLLYRAGGAAAEPLRVGRVRIPVEAAPYADARGDHRDRGASCRGCSAASQLFTLTVSADELALIGLVVLAMPAYLVLHAHDSRRFALGIMTAAVLWFVAWYPNLSGLPMPNSIANIYQGLLPTWNYDFWFAVNKDPLTKGPLGALALAS